MLGNEDLVLLVNLSQLVAEKMEEPMPHVCGLVNGWIIITVVIFYSLIIRGARLGSDPRKSIRTPKSSRFVGLT